MSKTLICSYWSFVLHYYNSPNRKLAGHGSCGQPRGTGSAARVDSSNADQWRRFLLNGGETGVWGRSPLRGPGQSPWSGGQGQAKCLEDVSPYNRRPWRWQNVDSSLFLISSFSLSLQNCDTLTLWWRFGVAVARWSRSTWLSYIGPAVSTAMGSNPVRTLSVLTSHPGQLSLVIPPG